MRQLGEKKDDWFDIYKPFNNDLKRFDQERSQPNSFAKRPVSSNQPGTSHFRENSYRHNVGYASKNRFSGKEEFLQLEEKTDKFREQGKKFGKMRAYKTDENIAEEEPKKSEALNDEPDVYDRAYYQGMENEEERSNEQEDNDYVGPYLEDVNLVQIPNKPQTTPLELKFKHMTQQDRNKPTIKTAEKDKVCRICYLEIFSNNKLHNHVKLEHPRARQAGPSLSKTLHKSPVTSHRKINFTEPNNRTQIPQVISSTAAPSNATPGYAFRGRQYAQIKLGLNSPQNETYSVCLDTGCGMSLIDREFLRSLCPTIEIQNMKKEMKVKGLGSKLYDASQFVEVDFYLPTSKGIIAHFRREIHIVDKLDTRILLGMDIALPEGWVIDLDSQLLTLLYCAGIQAHIVTIKRDKECKIPVCSATKCVIPAQSRSFVAVASSKGEPLSIPQRDLIYEPIQQQSCTTFAHLVSGECTAIMMENSSDRNIIISRYQPLGNLIDFDAQFMTVMEESEVFHLTQSAPKSVTKRLFMKGLLAGAATVTTTKTMKSKPQLDGTRDRQETLLKNGITIFGDTQQTKKL
ncbi:hypothetical protein GcC1_104013 [Golovinomyces cichoracearum]|uniref:Peptidase A2 domain-containing protein n=1 Tax=Golovinomyces cichoracearum TaxID=62708 RepID=A0A420I9M8_9PEZI|nr:hypothetical protein GcC1_104013 [Golovinomyces cichoracearum]